MKKKFTINPKLKTYSALAGSFLATGNMATASVVYHDVTPDVTKTQTTMGQSSYAIDMDNDGTNDFTLIAQKISTTKSSMAITGTGVTILPASGNGVDYKQVKSGNTSASYALALNANDNINNTLNWYIGGTGSSSSAIGLPLAGAGTVGGVPFTTGQFHNVTNKYIGVKFTKGANTYYGWIRVDVGNYNTFTVKDWAYDNTAGTAIQAGQGMASGVSTYLSSVTTIIATNNIIEASFANPINGNIQIVNMNGAVVKAAGVNGNGCTINMNGMPTGIYNVIVSANEGTLAKKVYVE
jgi:hypothetical protein